MADTQRDLLDEDGENRALRSFLMQYGLPGLTVGAMRDHMKRSGWGGEYWPFFVSASNRDTHLTKGGAQVWIRHLLGMEVASRPAEVDDWISVEDRLPSTEDLPNGDCPSVIALWKPGALAENLVQQMVITTAYLCKNVEKFTHWMNLPAAPSHTTNKEKKD